MNGALYTFPVQLSTKVTANGPRPAQSAERNIQNKKGVVGNVNQLVGCLAPGSWGWLAADLDLWPKQKWQLTDRQIENAATAAAAAASNNNNN